MHHQTKAALYIREKAIASDQSYEDIANNIGVHLREDFDEINKSFQPAIVQEAIRETTKYIGNLKKRYDDVRDLRAEINQYEDQVTAELRQEFEEAGGNYDIIDGKNVHDLTNDQFQHNVGIIRNILLRRRQMVDSFE